VLPCNAAAFPGAVMLRKFGGRKVRRGAARCIQAAASKIRRRAASTSTREKPGCRVR
jgi:hypothetical protein